MNLFVSEIFKDSVSFKKASSNAILIASYFHNSNNKYFIGNLRDLQKENYGDHIHLAIPRDTRWNSHYECYKTLIKSKLALQVKIFIKL